MSSKSEPPTPPPAPRRRAPSSSRLPEPAGREARQRVEGRLAELGELVRRLAASARNPELVDYLARIERSRRALDRMERSRLLAGASHDLRQPLHALSLLIEGLADRAEDGKTREMVDRISASSRTLEEMFTGLLDLSRLEAGDAAWQLSPVALRPVLERLVEEVRPAAEAKGLRLAVLPRDVHVLSEPVMLHRIVGNLVHNAVRHTERGSVLIAVRDRGERVRIEVRDSGPGIAQDEQAAIFQAFHRTESGRASAEGLGLGLAVVQGLSHALGHEIELRSAPGRGSVFAVTAARAEPAPLPAHRHAPRVALFDLREEEQRELTGRFEEWGLQVVEPSKAPEVWLLAATRPADLRDRLAALRGRHGESPPAVALLDEAVDARPLGPDEPVFGLPRPAPPARLRSLLNHVTRRADAPAR